MAKSDFVTAEIHLAYFKQGDDLHYSIEQSKSPLEALRGHAEQMRSVAGHLDAIADEVAKCEEQVELYGDTHYCSITGPESLIARLIELELVTKEEYDDEDEDEDDEDFDDDYDDEELQ